MPKISCIQIWKMRTRCFISFSWCVINLFTKSSDKKASQNRKKLEMANLRNQCLKRARRIFHPGPLFALRKYLPPPPPSSTPLYSPLTKTVFISPYSHNLHMSNLLCYYNLLPFQYPVHSYALLLPVQSISI